MRSKGNTATIQGNVTIVKARILDYVTRLLNLMLLYIGHKGQNKNNSSEEEQKQHVTPTRTSEEQQPPISSFKQKLLCSSEECILPNL